MVQAHYRVSGRAADVGAQHVSLLDRLVGDPSAVDDYRAARRQSTRRRTDPVRSVRRRRICSLCID
jgi:hypothetical protein